MASIEPKQQGSGKRSTKRSTRIDMTAMVDVAFLLLTFFILTTTLGADHYLKMAVPAKDGTSEVLCDKVLTFYLGEDDKVYWYGGGNCEMESMALSDLGPSGVRAIVLEKQQTVDDLIISIKPGKRSKYKNLVDIFDEMKITQASKYALAPITQEEMDFLELRGMK